MMSERINHKPSDGCLIPSASTPVTSPIQIHWIENTPTVDSRIVANWRGIQHKNELANIRKHLELMGATEMGAPRELTVPPGESAHKAPNLSIPVKRSTKPQTIFLLTEEQALFLCTLGRNSEQVVRFKIELILAFAKARRQQLATVPAVDVSRLSAYEQRLVDLEQQLNHLLHAQQRAAQLLLGVDRSTEAMPEETVRMKIQRIVNGYCHAISRPQQDVWRQVYERLNYRYGVRIRAYKKSERESWLDVADRTGNLSKIYAIVSAELRY